MSIKLTKRASISNFSKPYIIAEIGANHNGDMALARKMIIEAKEAGANCVKFQSWSKDSVFSKIKYEENHFLEDDYRDRSDVTLEEIVDSYSISEEELLEMRKFAEDYDIDFTSTPFSKKEVDFLVDELNAPFIKVASMDLNNYQFLKYIGEKGKPVLISTGLSSLGEIDRAVRTLEGTGNTDICVLHCVATYPPLDEDVNLNNIKTLMAAFPEYPIGFSDHSLGFELPLASAALGVSVIEKHFTLDKEMEGWDHKVSADKSELSVIASGTLRVAKALGSSRLQTTESPEQISEFRRSIVLSRSLLEGHKVTMDDLDFKRPGRGFPPEYAEYIVGRMTSQALDIDHILKPEDLL